MGALLVGALGEAAPKLRRINLHYWEECVKDNHLENIPYGVSAFQTWEKVCGPLDVLEMAKESREEYYTGKLRASFTDEQIENMSTDEIKSFLKIEDLR